MPSIPDSHRDLLDGMVATLATVGSNGYPQMSELWFLAEGDTIRLSLNTSRQKTRNLMKRPACGLLLLDLANPGRYLELRGDAQIEPDPDYVFADRVAAKYGADLRAMDQPGESRVVVTLNPTRVRAWG
ncbi:MAG: PPOX class F420-dependent oxidoreductase [Streptosporangiaceae bacterium]